MSLTPHIDPPLKPRGETVTLQKLPDRDMTPAIVRSLASMFLADAEGNIHTALLLACAALHGTAKLVPTGMVRAGPPSERAPKPPPPSI